MKKSVFLSILSYIVLVGNATLTSGQNSGSDDPKQIIIVQSSTIPPGSPRMPAYNPFYAELENGNVVLGSYSYCGTVEISLTSTVGDDYSTAFDTADGTIRIPISGNTGDYILLITMATGLEFIGEFSL